jgi:hypothetical protein
MEACQQNSDKRERERKKGAPEYSDTSVTLHLKVNNYLFACHILTTLYMVLCVEIAPAKESGLFWLVTTTFMSIDDISYVIWMIKGKNRLVPDLYPW